MKKLVYIFGKKNIETGAKDRNLLGGKGANLAEMSSLGFPVPPGFTITTEVCNEYYNNDKSFPQDLNNQLSESLKQIEELVGRKFGCTENPLLVSVRSGARVSMPGMMDTVLNLGLNDLTVKGLAKQFSNERFAYDSYRRFIQMYSDVVLGVEMSIFEEMLELKKHENNYSDDTDLNEDDLKELVAEYKDRVKHETGAEFPQDVNEQLKKAINAVFDSWMNRRAIKYRNMHNYSHEWGTAVNVQAMVFGNRNNNSATGVAFTRNPATGEKEFYGEYLINAQGEDVVAGIRTPNQITIAGKEKNNSDVQAMEEAFPEVYQELCDTYQRLEKHYKDMQDIEFTVEEGKLYILQTRSGKRTAKASIRIAVEMYREGLISQEEALLRIDSDSIEQLLHPMIDPNSKYEVIDQGLPASPGAACGLIVFSADKAEEMANDGKKTILVRIETSPEDIHGMNAAVGILTARGGMTSHAAVVARGMGKTCITAASNIVINYEEKQMNVGSYCLKEGDLITINGSTGEIIKGEVQTMPPSFDEYFEEIMKWADIYRVLNVRTNAETAEDAKIAIDFGAEGIGLCRTEHMFFDEERINFVREMILAESKKDREAALKKLLPFQKQDFADLFEIMGDLPVNIRLLDPPLHEFLPHQENELDKLSEITGKSVADIKASVLRLKEANPMLGHRGCRLGITYPEIYNMQVRAILEAACENKKTSGKSPKIEIMVPLVMTGKELEFVKKNIEQVAQKTEEDYNEKIDYVVGTMIELPRAAIMAHEIAEHAMFFSFGTNDLTQTAMGISRDDSANFLKEYKEKGILAKDPFMCLDSEGVGELMKIAIERGRKVKSNLKIGICGEHGGDPSSVKFCHNLNLDYVSCSPFRVPVAKLSAAQEAIVFAKKKHKAA